MPGHPSWNPTLCMQHASQHHIFPHQGWNPTLHVQHVSQHASHLHIALHPGNGGDIQSIITDTKQLYEKKSTFTFSAPLWFAKIDAPPIPNVFPYEKTIKKFAKDNFSESANPKYKFPPPGKSLEVAYIQYDAASVGNFKRTNLGLEYYAWLTELKDRSVRLSEADWIELATEMEHVVITFTKVVRS